MEAAYVPPNRVVVLVVLHLRPMSIPVVGHLCMVVDILHGLYPHLGLAKATRVSCCIAGPHCFEE